MANSHQTELAGHLPSRVHRTEPTASGRAGHRGHETCRSGTRVRRNGVPGRHPAFVELSLQIPRHRSATKPRRGTRRVSSSKAEECHHSPLDLNELLGCQPANPGVDVRPSDRRELVDHHVTIVVESRKSPISAANNANAHQRSIQQRAGHRRYGDRIRGIEEVILNDYRRARLRRVNTSGHGPDFPSIHSSSHRAEIASMKSWSSLLASALATSEACLCASAAKVSVRTSGTHTCSGLRPRSRIRRRYSPTLSLTAMEQCYM